MGFNLGPRASPRASIPPFPYHIVTDIMTA
jgi:hypothetical protein